MRSLIIITFFIFLKPVSAISCTCLSQTVGEAYASTDIIFKGQVIKVDTLIVIDSILIAESGSARWLLRAREMSVTQFRVNQTIKGNITTKYISVYSNNRCCTCGFTFFVDDTYLVYANTRSIATTKIKELTSNQEVLAKADKKISQVF